MIPILSTPKSCPVPELATESYPSIEKTGRLSHLNIDVEVFLISQQLHDVQLVGGRRPVEGEPAVVVLPFAEFRVDLERPLISPTGSNIVISWSKASEI